MNNAQCAMRNGEWAMCGGEDEKRLVRWFGETFFYFGVNLFCRERVLQ